MEAGIAVVTLFQPHMMPARIFLTWLPELVSPLENKLMMVSKHSVRSCQSIIC